MVGMLMSSSKLFLFSHEAHLNSDTVHPYPNIFENGDFTVFEKNSRPQEYDRYLVWRAFSKTSIFVVAMLFTCVREVQTEKKISVFENIRIRVETASGIVLCFSRQACCLLFCLCDINNDSHTYQFTFELLLLCFRMWLWFQIRTKISADRRIWPKKGTDLYTPIHSSHQWIKFI